MTLGTELLRNATYLLNSLKDPLTVLVFLMLYLGNNKKLNQI
jgi:hypothetical protein